MRLIFDLPGRFVMTPERWKLIGDVYFAALQLAPHDRPAFLEQACQNDAELRHEVTSLLDSEDKARGFFESSPDDLVAGVILSKDQSHALVGRTLGRYELRSLIGKGGMGEVYRAYDATLDRDVAVKMLPEHLAGDYEALRRFEREAKAVAGISHPNVCPIYDFGRDENRSYAVMELLEGHTFRKILETESLSWQRAVEIGVSICEGLHAAHSHGIIHRDLKPENIFLTTEGQVKILDFGIAKLKRNIVAETESEVSTLGGTTQPGAVMGTLGYMSPEQLRGETADVPSDIFSFGCVLYELASGVRPFAGETRTEIIAAVLNNEPSSLSQSDKNIPSGLEKVIRHCLEKNPQDRYQSARAVEADLKALLDPETTSASASRRIFEPRMIVLGLIAICLIVSLGYWWKSRPGNEAVPRFKSIAVLPFRSLKPEERNDHLGLGLADTVITKLGALRPIIVRPTGAVLKYSDPTQDPIAAGREQKVETVLDASLQQLGDRVRVMVRLLNVADQTTIWTYECEEVLCSNIFAMQDVIAERVAAALKTSLTGEERRRLRKRFTENKEALAAYSNGISHLNKLTREDVTRAIEFFREAIDKDPNYALAYVHLADSYGAMASFGWCEAKDCYPLAKAAVLKALGIDSELGEAYANLAGLLQSFDRNWDEAEKAYNKAIDLSPGYSMGHRAYAMYLIALGRFEEAKVRQQRAWELEPGSIINYITLFDLYYFWRDYDRAITIALEARRAVPDWLDASRRLADAYARNGQYEQSVSEHLAHLTQLGSKPETIAKIENAYRTSGMRGFWRTRYNLQDDGFSPEEDEKREPRPRAKYQRALHYALIGNKEGVIYCLQQDYKARRRLPFLKVEPLFDDVRSDPRFIELLHNIGLDR